MKKEARVNKLTVIQHRSGRVDYVITVDPCMPPAERESVIRAVESLACGQSKVLGLPGFEVVAHGFERSSFAWLRGICKRICAPLLIVIVIPFVIGTLFNVQRSTFNVQRSPIFAAGRPVHRQPVAASFRAVAPTSSGVSAFYHAPARKTAKTAQSAHLRFNAPDEPTLLSYPESILTPLQPVAARQSVSPQNTQSVVVARFDHMAEWGVQRSTFNVQRSTVQGVRS